MTAAERELLMFLAMRVDRKLWGFGPLNTSAQRDVMDDLLKQLREEARARDAVDPVEPRSGDRGSNS